MADELELGPAPDDIQETAPVPIDAPAAAKRRGRPPRDPNAPRKTRVSSRRSLADKIGGTLALINLSFAFMPDPWRGDMLDDAEIVALAKALDEAARANATMHKYLSAVLVDGGSMANLVMVVGVITGRRLARHGIIAPEFDDRLATFIGVKLDGSPTPIN